MNANDADAIEKRFTRLERELKLWKRAATATILLLVALAGFTATPRMREARAGDSSAGDLVVRSLTIVDENRHRRIELDGNNNTPKLYFLDDKGTQRVSLTASKNAALSLYDEKGTGRATLAYSKNGTSLDLGDGKEPERIMLAALSDGTPLLGLSDEKGTVRAHLVVHKYGPEFELSDEKGMKRASLKATKDDTGWEFFDENGTRRADLGAFRSGPTVGLFDGDGRPIWQAPR